MIARVSTKRFSTVTCKLTPKFCSEVPKMGFGNVVDVKLMSCKNQTKGDRDLKYGIK